MADDSEAAFLTKIVVPRRRPGTIRRPRLLELLQRADPGTIAVVQAPTGYGKTTLLVDLCHESRASVCWLSLDEWDRDLRVFLQYLRLGLNNGSPERPERSSAAGESLQDAVTAIVARMTEAPGGTWLVLDDLHTADDSEEVQEFLGHLLQRLPANSRVFITSRTPPALESLPRLRVTERLLEIGAQQLAFTVDEIAEYLRGRDKDASRAHVESVVSLTEGWPAAVALLSSNQSADPSQPAASMQLVDYLAAEVFHKLPAEEQEFLVRTSLLDVLEPSACAAVLSTSIDDAAEQLEELPRRNLPMSPLPTSPPSWRVHPILRDYLLKDLARQPSLCKRLHRRAGAWCASRGRIREAVWHMGEGGDWPAVTALIRQEAPNAYRLGQWHTVMSWLDQLPERQLQDCPELRLWEARILARLGQTDGALRVVMDTMARTPTDTLAAELESVKAAALRLKGEARAATESARRAVELAVLGNSPIDVLTEARRELGLALMAGGAFEEAVIELRLALDIVAQRGDTEGTAFLNGCLGSALGSQGRLPESASHLEQARQKWRQLGNAKELSWVLNNLGMTYANMGHHQLSREVLTEAVRTARESGNKRAEAYSLDTLADVERDAGEAPSARSRYREVIELATELGEMTLSSLALLGLADLDRIAGDRESAERLARRVLVSAEERDSTYEQALANLVLGRTATAAGDLDPAVLSLSSSCDLFERSHAFRELAESLFTLATALIHVRYSRLLLKRTLTRLPEVTQAIGYDSFLEKHARESPDVLRYAISRHIHADYYRDLMKRSSGLPAEPVQKPERTGGLPVVEVVALGTLEVSVDGRLLAPADWQSEKSRELFLMLLFGRSPLRRDEIVSTLWPEKGGARSVSSFHTTLYRARKALYQSCLIEESGSYRLNPAGAFRSDVQRFQAAADAVRKLHPADEGYVTELRRAVEIYRGPFASTVDAEWADDLRRILDERFLELAGRLASALVEGGQYADASDVYERILSSDPLNEPACYGAMKCQLALHNPEAADKMYRRYRSIVEAELGQKPGEAIEELHRRAVGPGILM